MATTPYRPESSPRASRAGAGSRVADLNGPWRGTRAGGRPRAATATPRSPRALPRLACDGRYGEGRYRRALAVRDDRAPPRRQPLQRTLRRRPPRSAQPARQSGVRAQAAWAPPRAPEGRRPPPYRSSRSLRVSVKGAPDHNPGHGYDGGVVYVRFATAPARTRGSGARSCRPYPPWRDSWAC